MILNEIDLSVLRQFLKLDEDEETTTWEIMKKIHRNGGNRQHDGVKRSIEKMTKYGFFEIGKQTKKYIMLEDSIEMINKLRFPDITADAICIKVDGKWQAIQV